jgi:hypothetical protein
VQPSTGQNDVSDESSAGSRHEIEKMQGTGPTRPICNMEVLKP